MARRQGISFTEEKIYMGTPDTKRLILAWDQSSFLAKVKAEDTTPLIFLHNLITETMYAYYSLENKTIIAYVPVDLRGKLGSRSQSNLTFNVELPLDDRLLALPARERYARLKAMLMEKVKIENIASAVNAVKPIYDTLDTMSFKDGNDPGQMIDLSRVTKSYLLSNIGLIHMPEDMSRYVADVDICFTTMEPSPVYTMLTFANKGMLVIGQNYKETGLMEALGDRLTALGIENRLEDQGLIRLDNVDIRRFKHD